MAAGTNAVQNELERLRKLQEELNTLAAVRQAPKLRRLPPVATLQLADHVGTLRVRRPRAQITLLQLDGPVAATRIALPDGFAIGVWLVQILAPEGFGLEGGRCQVPAEAQAESGGRHAAFGRRGWFRGSLFGVVFRAVSQFLERLLIDFDQFKRGEHTEQVAIADALLGDDLLFRSEERRV